MHAYIHTHTHTQSKSSLSGEGAGVSLYNQKAAIGYNVRDHDSGSE
jgi:hypothetical protein